MNSPRSESFQYATGEAAAAKSLQSCPTLCDPIDGSPPGFSVPGIPTTQLMNYLVLSASSFINTIPVTPVFLTQITPVASYL